MNPDAKPECAVDTVLWSSVIPEKVKVIFARGDVRAQEARMWQAVAARMTLDAFGSTPEASYAPVRDKYKYNAYRRTVMEARAWFKKREDPEIVFGMWDGDVKPVRQAVAALHPIAPFGDLPAPVRPGRGHAPRLPS